MASVTILSDNGATSGSAGLKTTGGNDGTLLFQTTTSGGVATTAITISNTQVVTFANQPTYTGGTANGVLYLNGSKAVTSGTALVFDGTNLGVGVTPSASWQSGRKAFQLGLSLALDSGTVSQAIISSNRIYNGTNDIYINTAAAAAYEQVSGTHRWYTAASGTAGANISFTQSMMLDSSGNLGIGTTSPGRPLEVSGAGTLGTQIKITNTGNSAGVQMVGARTYEIQSDSASQYIIYDRTASAYRMKIDSSGDTTFLGNLVANPSTTAALQSFPDNTVGFVDPTHTSGWSVSNGIAGRTSDNVWAMGANAGVSPGSFWYLGVGSIAGGTFVTGMSVNKNGVPLFPNRPSFYAYTPGGPSTTSTGVVVFNTTRVNIGSHYNTSNGRFTAPVDGVYQFVVRLLLRTNGNAGSGEATLYLNGANLGARGKSYAVGQYTNGHIPEEATVILSLAAGDYVQAAVYSLSASLDFYYGDELGAFCGTLIG